MSKRNKNHFSGRISPPISVTQNIAFQGNGATGLHPLFSFRHITTGKYCMKKCSIEQFRSLSDKLRILSTLDWNTIESSPRETNGYERLPPSALSHPMPDAFSSEPAVIVFRFGGNKGRMVGIKQENCFFVLFIDHDFTLYKHG